MLLAHSVVHIQPLIPALCGSLLHLCFIPGEADSPQRGGRSALINFINDCQAPGKAQEWQPKGAECYLCVICVPLGPETLKGH